ncbi:MAG: hypothetical protein HDR89_02090 [Bacteroides sp.]|nr:hypothetical protein [Bacteroides sp.]
MLTEQQIHNVIASLPFHASISTDSFKSNDNGIIFKLAITAITEKGEENLEFVVLIAPYYPFHYQGHEGIEFFNYTLMDYSHIMEAGNLCLHSPSNVNAEEKLYFDLLHLWEWIQKYYVRGENDCNYEHLVVNEGLLGENYISIAFTNDAVFNDGKRYGISTLVELHSSLHQGRTMNNYLAVKFECADVTCDVYSGVSNIYRGMSDCIKVPFLLLDKAPAAHNKFVVSSIPEFSSFCNQEQLSFINSFAEKYRKKNKGSSVFPVLVGYPTVSKKIHWITLLIDSQSLPWHGKPEIINGRKTGRWLSVPNEGLLSFAKTENISKEYFFGRGALSPKLTDKKILIIGIGAVGSILAHTLVKGGCVDLTIYDFDTKSYGNCCRSEYGFISGITAKMDELWGKLIMDSPFVAVSRLPSDFDLCLKSYIEGSENEVRLREFLNKFDVIFDCSADDDLSYILEKIHPTSTVLSISITNNARELIVAVSPNVTAFQKFAVSNLAQDEGVDMFYPIGCWNPTFKASYNDISTVLQFGIKKINQMFDSQATVRSFIVKANDNGISVEMA